MTRAVVLLAVLLSACGSSTSLPAPRIVSVEPNQALVGHPTPVLIRLDAALPIRVDYGQGEAQTQRGTSVWFGRRQAEVRKFGVDGTLSVDLPADLLADTYDVRVVLADGREASSPKGFDLRDEDGSDAGPDGIPDGGIYVRDGGPEEPDAGTDPNRPMSEGDITGYEFEPILDQTVGQPFIVTVRAVGPRAAEFTDKVDLAISKNNGGISPTSLDRFSAGVCVQSVSIDAQGDSVILTVTDRFGVEASSNSFKVK